MTAAVAATALADTCDNVCISYLLGNFRHAAPLGPCLQTHAAMDPFLLVDSDGRRDVEPSLWQLRHMTFKRLAERLGRSLHANRALWPKACCMLCIR